MPSASGVYSLPLGYLAVTGATIQASQHNPPLEDIALALTGRLSRDGTAPMTGGLQGIVGTAAIPSYAFSTDTTTGLFKTTNGLGIAVGGVQVAEFTAAGMASGVRMLGEIIPWVRATCPALFVFPVGQTLSRTAYAALWTQAQIEIAAGNSFFNNGNGSTTFGIGDARGRGFVAIDNMGGSDAARLAGGGALASGRFTIGFAGGEAAHTLIPGEIPTLTSSGTNSISVSGSTGTIDIGSGVAGVQAGGNNIGTVTATGSVTVVSTGNNNISVTSQNTGGAGGGTANVHNNMQPTILCQFIMFAGA